MLCRHGHHDWFCRECAAVVGLRFEEIGANVEVGNTIHVYPTFDSRPHLLLGDGCWCGPTRDTEYPEVLIHHPLPVEAV